MVIIIIIVSANVLVLVPTRTNTIMAVFLLLYTPTFFIIPINVPIVDSCHHWNPLSFSLCPLSRSETQTAKRLLCFNVEYMWIPICQPHSTFQITTAKQRQQEPTEREPERNVVLDETI
jgi:hypothetical protein